ncbi:hypothetical protein [Methylomonas fluvii]|nr:hypothetical protein [Methylomonas fluvii]
MKIHCRQSAEAYIAGAGASSALRSISLVRESLRLFRFPAWYAPPSKIGYMPYPVRHITYSAPV